MRSTANPAYLIEFIYILDQYPALVRLLIICIVLCSECQSIYLGLPLHQHAQLVEELMINDDDMIKQTPPPSSFSLIQA